MASFELTLIVLQQSKKLHEFYDRHQLEVPRHIIKLYLKIEKMSTFLMICSNIKTDDK